MPTDPRDLAARPAFAAFLAALRGGEGPCPDCTGGAGEMEFRTPRFACKPCKGSGRVAVPPDPAAGAPAADWWQEQGGGLAGLLWVYALATPPGPKEHRGRGEYAPRPPAEDDSLRPALAAWDDVLCPARAAAVRGLRPDMSGYNGHGGTEWAWRGRQAVLALKRAVLACYDPCPACGGSGVTTFRPANAPPQGEGCNACGGAGDNPRGWPGVLAPCPACALLVPGRPFEETLRRHCRRCGGRGEVAPSSLPPAAGWEESREALRRAGGSGWDAVEDPEAYVREVGGE
jgi:hypothetical protein